MRRQRGTLLINWAGHKVAIICAENCDVAGITFASKRFCSRIAGWTTAYDND